MISKAMNQKGHNRNGLSLRYNIWSISWKTLEAEGCSHPKTWPQLEDPLLMWLNHVALKWMLDTGRRPQFFPYGALWGGLWMSSGESIWLFRVNDLKDQNISCDAFYYLKSHTILSTVFHWPYKSALIQCKRGLQKGTDTRKQDY